MQTQLQSPCIRCGKIRVIGKTWEEYVGLILVKFTNTICPDAACQKIVDSDLTILREKRELMASNRLKASKMRLKKN